MTTTTQETFDCIGGCNRSLPLSYMRNKNPGKASNLCKGCDDTRRLVEQQLVNALGEVPTLEYVEAKMKGLIPCAICGNVGETANHCHVCKIHVSTYCHAHNLGEGKLAGNIATRNCFSSTIAALKMAKIQCAAHGLDIGHLTIDELLSKLDM